MCAGRRGHQPRSPSGVKTTCDHVDWHLVAASPVCSQFPFPLCCLTILFLSFHNSFVVPVMVPVCCVAHVQVGPLNVTVHSVYWAHPAGGPCPVRFCIFYELSTSCFFCVFRECDSVCVFLTISRPACQVHKGSEEGRGQGRDHGHAAL